MVAGVASQASSVPTVMSKAFSVSNPSPRRRSVVSASSTATKDAARQRAPTPPPPDNGRQLTEHPVGRPREQKGLARCERVDLRSARDDVLFTAYERVGTVSRQDREP